MKKQPIRYISIQSRSDNSTNILSAFDCDVFFIKRLKLSLVDFNDSREVADLAFKARKSIPGNKFAKAALWFLLKLQYNWIRHYLEEHSDCIALCWNGVKGKRKIFAEAAKRAGLKTVFFEISPLPGRVTIDRVGINFENSLVRSSNFYLSWRKNTHESRDQWKLVRDKIVSRIEIINKNVQQNCDESSVIQSPYLFVPLQVQTDAQIRCFGGLIKSVTHFVEVVNENAKYLPPGWTIRIKEHPSSCIPYQLNEIITCTDRLVIDNHTDTMQLIKGSSGVVTVNSSVGIEALFFEKPVLVLGQAFYGFEGVARTVENLDEVAQIFSNPIELIEYDKPSVYAFLDYLCCEYYPEMSIQSDGTASINGAWLSEFKNNI